MCPYLVFSDTGFPSGDSLSPFPYGGTHYLGIHEYGFLGTGCLVTASFLGIHSWWFSSRDSGSGMGGSLFVIP